MATSKSTQHTPILGFGERESRSRFHSPHLPTSSKLPSAPILTAPSVHTIEEGAGDIDEKHARRILWAPLPMTLGRRKANHERRRILIGLGVGAGLGLILLVYVLSSRTMDWERWGLVSDMEGLVGGPYLDIGDWRGIESPPVQSVKFGKGAAGGKQKDKAETKGKEKEKTKGKGKGKGKEKATVDDGLYRFNPTDLVHNGARHPISHLIEQAQTEWSAKVARQSKTLKAAVEEYRRRYRRAPPKGFEKWWAYVQQNNVPLPDEYDQISRDIHLFHPHRPATVKAKLAKAAKLSDTYVIRNTGGRISVERNFDPAKHRGGEERIKAQVGMVEDVAEYIGDFEAVWSVHDTGRMFTSWSQRKELEDALSEGSYVEREPDESEDTNGWSALCPMSTNFGAALFPKTPKPADTSSTSKSFVSSLSKSLSICARPGIVPMHGATSGPYAIPSTSGHLPLFSLSRTSVQSDILGIPFSHLISRPPTAWADKTEEKLLWRGGLTGSHYDELVNWRETQRFRLIDIAKRPGSTNLLAPGYPSAELIKTTYAKAAAHYLDIAPTGAPIQCDKATCDIIAAEYDFAPRMSHAEAGAYKYVMDVDGNAWSARFKGLLSTGTVVLKSTIMPEWWNDRAQPWVHFVPVDVGYDDLLDIMAYFTGDLSGHGGNDADAQTIAEAGQEWAATHWRQEDMVAYSFRMYLEWARVWGGGDRKAGYVYAEADEV